MDAPPPSFATNRGDDFGLLRQDFPKRREPKRVGGADIDDGFAEDVVTTRRQPGWRVRLGGRVPRSFAGRIGAGCVAIVGLAGSAYGLHVARRSLTHDARLAIPSSRAIEITGNNRLTRAQLLSVFGEDVDRNLLTVPLESRRAELESLPWVEHATVMRLLPNRVRVAIRERTPVAFVRQGGEIGLVDAHGVLLDMAGGEAGEAGTAQGYSFPVITGVSAKDPASVRAARMKLYLRFTEELDEGAEKHSKKLSEVDLTDPEDVKALLAGDNVLVHLGDKDFLSRYENYQQHLPDWKAKYPKLASVDMRYEREVVLQMAPGSAVPVDPMPDAGEAKTAAVAAKKTGPQKVIAGKKAPPVRHAANKAVDAVPMRAAAPQAHLQEAFDVKANPGKGKAKADPQ